MKKVLLLCLSSLLLTLVGCNENGGKTPEPDVPNQRTVIAYIFEDIDLWDLLAMSVNQMEAGYDSVRDGKLIVFLDKSPNFTQFKSPVLLEIVQDKNRKIVSKVVKTYPDRDAANPEVVREVIQDAIDMYPAKSYGLMMAGHGDGSIFRPENDYKKRHSVRLVTLTDMVILL